MTAPALRALALLTLLAPVLAAADTRVPVPGEADVEKAVDDVRTLYKADFAKKAPADGRALAAKLLRLGLDTRDNAAARFALLREAAELAAASGDPAGAVKAVTQLTAEFRVDTVAVRSRVLDKAAATAPAADAAGHSAVAVAAVETADEAVKADQYDEAVRLVALATRAAPRAKDDTVVKRTAARAAEIKEAAAEYPAAKAAETRLAADPKDAAAARTAGRFRCIFKGNWQGGLPLLAEHGDGKWKELAGKDLDATAKPAGQAPLADAYWQQAAREKGATAAALRRRAGHWYRRALPELTGLERDRAVKRMEEADPFDPLAALDPTNGTFSDDHVRVKLYSQIRTLAEYTGPIEVRVVARTKGNNIRLHAVNGSCVIFNWELNDRELRVTRPDGVNGRLESGSIATAQVKPLTPDTWYTLRWRMTATQIDVWVDDKLVFTERGRYNLSTRSPVKIGAMEHPVDVRSITVRPAK